MRKRESEWEGMRLEGTERRKGVERERGRDRERERGGGIGSEGEDEREEGGIE